MTGFVCIGGPKDGQLVSHEERYFFCQEVPKLSQDITETVTVTNFVYVKDVIRTPHSQFFYWRPEKQSVDNTLQMLFDGYKKGA
jgi:hypothetical protein